MRKINQRAKAEQWCQEHGWTEMFELNGKYYAFPPGTFMFLQVPVQLEKQEKPTILSVVGISFLYSLVMVMISIGIEIVFGSVSLWFLPVGFVGGLVLSFLLWAK